MACEAKKYHDYARECAKQAAAARNEDDRQKLTDLARVWREAALNEEASAGQTIYDRRAPTGQLPLGQPITTSAPPS